MTMLRRARVLIQNPCDMAKMLITARRLDIARGKMRERDSAVMSIERAARDVRGVLRGAQHA